MAESPDRSRTPTGLVAAASSEAYDFDEEEDADENAEEEEDPRMLGVAARAAASTMSGLAPEALIMPRMISTATARSAASALAVAEAC